MTDNGGQAARINHKNKFLSIEINKKKKEKTFPTDLNGKKNLKKKEEKN